MDDSFFLCLCLIPLFIYLLLFSQRHSVFCLLAVTSVAPRLTHLVFITWLSRCWSLNLISSLLLYSAHPTIQWPLEPRREGIIPVRGEQSSAPLECTDLTCTHSHGHPYLYISQGIIQVHCYLSSVMSTFWSALLVYVCWCAIQMLLTPQIQLCVGHWYGCPSTAALYAPIVRVYIYVFHCTRMCMYLQTVPSNRVLSQWQKPIAERNVICILGGIPRTFDTLVEPSHRRSIGF